MSTAVAKVGEAPQLDERARAVLRGLIERYVSEGQPIGSRILSRDLNLGLSPASIRNVMADLEELGLISSPSARGP